MNDIKVNIIYNKSDYLNGYINISPFDQENKDIKKCNIYDLYDICDNGECSQIIALDVIEYIPHNMINSIISNWVGKLRVGGQLILGFVETEELCRLFYRGHIPFEHFNSLVHGTLEQQHLVKLCSFSAPSLIENLTKAHTIKLKKHTLNSVDCVLVFERYK